MDYTKYKYNKNARYNVEILKTQWFLWLDDALFKAVPKGRRAGLTTGGIFYSALNKDFRIRKNTHLLWADTTIQNCWLYYNEKLRPLLNFLNVKHTIDKKNSTVEFNDSLIQFRGFSRPENWEGHNYDIIIVNEAGINFKNLDAWQTTIHPMLLDNSKSEAVLIGTPKGMNGFATLAKSTLFKSFQYSTYDNHKIPFAKIKQLEESIPKKLVRQEIYGDFVRDVGALVEADWLKYYTHREHDRYDIIVLGVDLAISTNENADFTAVVTLGIRGDNLYIIDVDRIKTGLGHIDFIKEKYKKFKAHTIGIETNNFQQYLANEMNRQGYPIQNVVSTKDKETRFYPVAKQFELGNVYINTQFLDKKEMINGEEINPFIAELLTFPTTDKSPDMLDALSIAYMLSNNTINWSYYE